MKKSESHTITNYFNDKLNLEEKNKLDRWLEKERNQEKFKQYAIANHFSDLSVKKYDDEKAFENFVSGIESGQKKTKNKIFYLQRYYKYAAILIVAVLLGIFFINKNRVRLKRMATIEVPNGEKRNIVLPDGSKVMINSASTFSYNKDFLNERIVQLDGEAYFEVSKYKDKFFIVELNGSTKIKVLGTSFDVKSYQEDTRIETTLFEGKIEIIYKTLSKDRFIIEPNTTAIIDKEKNTMELLIDDDHTKDALSWKDDKFSFNHEYLSDIIHELNRFYDVEIAINSKSLGSQYFTASFKGETELIEILRELSISGSFKIKEIDASHFELFY